MAKYLFLDIDGVLNHEEWYETLHKRGESKPFPLSCFDPSCVKRVNEILDTTGAELVISSSWRLDSGLYDTLSLVGLNKKFTCTPSFKQTSNGIEAYDCRGEEIEAYISKKNSIESYCILDDDSDMLDSQQEFFVQTCASYSENPELYEKNHGTGLTEEVKDLAIKVLSHNYYFIENKY